MEICPFRSAVFGSPHVLLEALIKAIPHKQRDDVVNRRLMVKPRPSILLRQLRVPGKNKLFQSFLFPSEPFNKHFAPILNVAGINCIGRRHWKFELTTRTQPRGNWNTKNNPRLLDKPISSPAPAAAIC